MNKFNGQVRKKTKKKKKTTLRSIIFLFSSLFDIRFIFIFMTVILYTYPHKTLIYLSLDRDAGLNERSADQIFLYF